jgi:hypothetical protein
MLIADEKIWNEWIENNKDSYGSAVIRYAKAWAELMEERINSGEKLEDIAEETSQIADTEGITGFMYGAAVSTLAGSWKYGEQLRRWHNLDTQIADEGEKANEKGTVLNPAVLNIG